MVLTEHQEPMEPAALMVVQGHRVLLALTERPVQVEYREHRVLQAQVVLQVLMEQMVLQVLQVLAVHQVLVVSDSMLSKHHHLQEY